MGELAGVFDLSTKGGNLITIPRVLLRRLRMAFSRGLGITAKQTGPPVNVIADHTGVTFQTCNDDFAIEYVHAGEQESVSFTAPFDLFRRFEGKRKNDQVTLQYDSNAIFAEWFDGSLPKSGEVDAVEPVDMPALPTQFAINPPELLNALCEAAKTAEVESTRYALTHIQLRGSDGQVAATDGRQLLIQSGFDFPWEEERLVPANKLIRSNDLCRDVPVEIGAAPDWVVLRTGPWTVWLKTLKDGRFPKANDIVPNRNSSTTTMHVSDADADFLNAAAKNMPGNDEHNAPVTVDLNGAVTIRTKGTGDMKPTEVVLTGSRRDGDAVRFSTDRRMLTRALSLGFRSVEVINAETPACCREPNRTYLWALLQRGGIIKPDPDATRVESAIAKQAHSTAPLPKAIPPMKKNDNTNGDAATKLCGQSGTEVVSVEALIASAEETRSTMRDSASQLTKLIADLKQHRKQTKSLQSALKSIRELQPAGV